MFAAWRIDSIKYTTLKLFDNQIAGCGQPHPIKEELKNYRSLKNGFIIMDESLP
jgi:hypothetical protein